MSLTSIPATAVIIFSFFFMEKQMKPWENPHSSLIWCGETKKAQTATLGMTHEEVLHHSVLWWGFFWNTIVV